MDWIAPYSSIAIYKGLAGANNLNVIENKIGEVEENETLPMWTRLLMDARTFFEQSQVV